MVKAIIRGARANVRTATGTQEITVSGVTDTPKAAMLWMSGTNDPEGQDIHARLCVGLTDGTNVAGVGIRSRNNQASTSTTRVCHDASLLRMPGAASGTDYVMTLDAMIAGGIRVDFPTNPPGDDFVLNAIFWFGDDIEASVDIVDPGASGSVKVTTNFEPQHLIAVGGESDFTDTNADDAYLCLGQAINDGVGGSTTYSYTWLEGDGLADGSPACILDDERLSKSTRFSISPAIYNAGIKLTDSDPFESDGYNVESDGEGTGNPFPMAILSISYGGKGVALLPYLTKILPTGTKVFTGVGFKPWSLLTFQTGVDDTSWGTKNFHHDSEAGTFGIGFASSDEEFSAGYTDEDGVTTTNCDSDAKGLALSRGMDDGGFLLYSATLGSFDGDGFTLTFGAGGLVRHQLLAFLLEQDWFEAQLEVTANLVVGDLVRQAGFTASLDALATFTASLSIDPGYVAALQADSDWTALLVRERGLVVDFTTTANLAAELNIDPSLVADLQASADLVVGDLERLAAFDASLDVTADLTAAPLVREADLVAELLALGEFDAQISVERTLAAALEALAEISAALETPRAFVIDLVAEVDVVATLTLDDRSFVADLVAEVDMVAALTIERVLAADLVAETDVVTALRVERVLAADLVAEVDVVTVFTIDDFVLAGVVLVAEVGIVAALTILTMEADRAGTVAWRAPGDASRFNLHGAPDTWHIPDAPRRFAITRRPRTWRPLITGKEPTWAK